MAEPSITLRASSAASGGSCCPDYKTAITLLPIYLHNIYHFNHCMALSTFTGSCNHHHNPFPNHFYHHKQQPDTITRWLPIPPSPLSLATSSLLPIFMNLPVLETTYKWHHPIFDFLCLAYVTNRCFQDPSMLLRIHVFKLFETFS